MRGQVPDFWRPSLKWIHKFPGFLKVCNYDCTKLLEVFRLEHSLQELYSLGVFNAPNIQFSCCLLVLRHESSGILVGKISDIKIESVYRGICATHLLHFDVLILRFHAVLVYGLDERSFSWLRIAQEEQVGVALAGCVEIAFRDVVEEGLPEIAIASAIFFRSIDHLKIK